MRHSTWGTDPEMMPALAPDTATVSFEGRNFGTRLCLRATEADALGEPGQQIAALSG